MDSFLIMLKNVLMFVLLALPGYILIKTKILKQESSAVLSKVLSWVGMPFLILSGTLGITIDGSTLLSLAICTGLGIVFILAQFFITLPISLMERNKKTRGMMRFCQAFANNGFLGLPLAMAVFGAGSKEVMYLSILNILSNIFMYTLGAYLVSGDRKSINIKKALLSPVLIAFVIGIILNLSGVVEYVPEILTYSGHLKGLVTPLSMFVLGIKLAGVKFTSLFASWRMYYVSAIKLVVFPVAISAIMLALGKLTVADPEMIKGMFIAFAVPTAGLASAFADEYDGDATNAVAFTLGTTLISIATIPILYTALDWLLKL